MNFKKIAAILLVLVIAMTGFFAQSISEVYHGEYEGKTVMLAPASGFYTDPGDARNEVRLAYVLAKEDLRDALKVLEKALDAYPGRIK